jgi:leucyl aminopeptidase
MPARTATDALISMATLTGAARVAVGPDLAPYYTDDDAMAQALEAGAKAGLRSGLAAAVPTIL